MNLNSEHAGIPALYSFESTIPVLIREGKCRIDLKEMWNAISFLWEE